jgi:serine/threonine protein kinase/Flp pilus assembly protein TadD
MNASELVVRSNSSDQQSLGLLIEGLTARLQAGEVIDLEACVREHPQHAEQLRRLVPALHLLADLGSSVGSGMAAAVGPGDEVRGTLGDFRILREVGRGGMGIVYEAEQLSLSRRVALKVLPFAGALDAKQLQRFKNEAQAAAHLQHGNIVPVYFVGCERGVHYYAMQFIDGCTLAELIRHLKGLAPPRQGKAPPAAGCEGDVPPADDAALTTPYRPAAVPATAPAAETASLVGLSTASTLQGREHFRAAARLGLQAAEALQHAHELGVIHRDIKPGNLMLDGRGNLWVTDFGLAHMEAEATLTMSGDLVGTLRYMSPEQALAQRVAIDHRTDVYSLGATLYELLTLQPAFAGQNRQELLRQISFEEPQAPRKIDRAIPAELEIIVLKALAKNPAERYGTAQEMADDLRRFLEDKPIKARRPTLGQRLVRWSRRHQALVRSAVVVLLLAVIALATSTVLIARAWEKTEAALHAEKQALKAEEIALEGEAKQRQIAVEKAAEADAVVNYLVLDLLGSAAPEIKLGRPVTVEQALANAEKKIDSAFGDRPRVEAAVRFRLGDTYYRLGKYTEAERHLLQARELSNRCNGPTAAETLQVMHRLANVLMDQSKLPEARQLSEATVGLRRRVLGEDHPDTLDSMNNLAVVLYRQGRWEESRQLAEQVLGRMRRVLGEDHQNTLNSMHNLAMVLHDQGKREEARKLYEEILRRKRKVLGEDHPDTLRSMGNLALVLQVQGKWQEARKLCEEELRRMRKVLGEDHPDTLMSMSNLAGVLYYQGQWEEARRFEEEVLGRRRKVLGEDHPDSLKSMMNLAIVLAEQGKWEEARKLFEEVLPRNRKVLGEDHPDTLKSIHNLARVLQDQGKKEEAQQLHEEALARMRKAQGADHPATLNCMSDLAIVLIEQGKREEARPMFEEVLGRRRKVLGEDHPETLASMNNLANVLKDQCKLEEARRLNEEALGRRRKVQGEDHPDTLRSMNNLASVLREQGNWKEARKLAEEVLGRQRKVLGDDHRHTLVTMNELAWLLATCDDARQRDPTRAVELATKATTLAPQNGDFWNTLGVARYRAGDWRGAVEALNKSMELRKGGDSADWFFLAMAQWQLGEKEQARKRFDQAVAWINKNQPKDPELLRFRAEAAEILGIEKPPPKASDP